MYVLKAQVSSTFGRFSLVVCSSINQKQPEFSHSNIKLKCISSTPYAALTNQDQRFSFLEANV